MQINCKGKLIDISRPKIMGILNITPDSFYDGGKLKTDTQILTQAEKMLQEGATFLDVGGYSSRPGGDDVNIETELKRVVPVVELLIKNFKDSLISIDTFRSKVALECVAGGACLINDISGGNLDKNMFKTIAKLQVPYVIMHMRGNPQNMQQQTKYNDIITELIKYFSKKIRALTLLKVNDIIIDVGFGFSKTTEQNYQLLRHLEHFKVLERPVLTGVSRKSMLYKPLGITAAEALNATSVGHTIAILKGSNILRVHDVKPAIEVIKLVSEMELV
ncbi:MAG: dihydropteroate synthase [Flavobacteriales bacterium]|nr:MAG: dihydropteroate synthase [Flavobacteriales bacterium]